MRKWLLVVCLACGAAAAWAQVTIMTAPAVVSADVRIIDTGDTRVDNLGNIRIIQ